MQIPISFTVPNWLPDSFFYKGKKHGRFYIKYKLKVFIRDDLNKLDPIFTERQVIVQRKAFDSQGVEGSVTKEISGCMSN